MKAKIAFGMLIILLACKSPDDFENICDPPYLFEEKNKDLVDINIVVDNVFEPYCAPCHSTTAYQNGLTDRSGYLPLDRGITTLKSDISFLNRLESYVNFLSPEDSKLIQAMKKAGVLRADEFTRIQYLEPRNICEMPEDVIEGLVWWIENANGSITNLLN